MECKVRLKIFTVCASKAEILASTFTFNLFLSLFVCKVKNLFEKVL